MSGQQDRETNESPRWRRYLRLFGPDVAGDVDDEIGFHLERLERDFIAAGMDPERAREEARARFGDPDVVARWLRAHDTTDPLTFTAVAIVLGVTAVIASIVPALRAARLDPASVLRSD